MLRINTAEETGNGQMTSSINTVFLRFNRRAESAAPTQLVSTFVDAGPLSVLLSNIDHQIMYGRRGTGKTHALTYLAETRAADGHIAFVVDMRTIGSTGGICADISIPLSERATRLLVDLLGYIHDKLLHFAIENATKIDLSQAGPILDRFGDAASQVKVVGTTTETTSSEIQSASASTTGAAGGISSTGLAVGLSVEAGQRQSVTNTDKTTHEGNATHRVTFGDVHRPLTDFVALLDSRRIWIVLDEWSDIPLDLQPYLAEFIRRCLFPVAGITVKIGAIEHRSNFRIPSDIGGHVGIELGADATADVNLDDFMVFDNDSERAKDFFREFLFKHFEAAAEPIEAEVPSSPAELMRQGFTQSNAFEEFVRAIEGVPRDAINIISLAAQKALDGPISIPNIRSAANTWYQRDKQTAVSSAPSQHLLSWIIDKVIGGRRARAFLLLSGARHPLIDSLFDSRLLHVLKRNISGRDQPGVRYDVYKLDYGCYIDLITTAKAPQGLLPLDTAEGDDAKFVDVPPDDYRSIRRAILDIGEFEASR